MHNNKQTSTGTCSVLPSASGEDYGPQVSPVTTSPQHHTPGANLWYLVTKTTFVIKTKEKKEKEKGEGKEQERRKG